MSKHADEMREDTLGNVVIYKRGGGEDRQRILIAAHMDEIGLMVTKIEREAFSVLQPLAGLTCVQLSARK